MNWLRLFRQTDDRNRRLRAGRRPLVENLEGRQLQSGIVGQHIGMTAAMVQGGHIGTSVAAVAPRQGAHIDGIVGSHIGTNFASVAPRQGAHIDIIAILAAKSPRLQ